MNSHLTPLLPDLIEEPKETPYDVFQALCEATGNDPANAPEPFKRQQLGIARRLLRDGYCLGDIDGCLRYLRARQRWQTIDLRSVSNEIGGWVFAGKPRPASVQEMDGAHRHVDARSLLQRAQQLRAGGD